ncbi:MAG: hypothetical protein OJF49_004629 [Ktedonobacterales bacterium]|jgi:hypothetical protein|nr:MAG: hypothetical protein OJF49_004629 [Ktedonobacterales bacterium]
MAGKHHILGKHPRVRRALAVAPFCVLMFAIVGVVILRGVPGADASGTALTAGGPSARVEAGGLVMTLHFSPGPYFLSELVAAEMTLTNNTHSTYVFQGVPHANDCDQAIGTLLSGGKAPNYTVPTQRYISCPFMSSTLNPGQTWTITQLMPLTASGSITLTAQVGFIVSATAADGSHYQTASEGPFANHWPTLHLSVSPQIPAGYTIALHQQPDHRVRIIAPSAARLYWLYDVRCNANPGFAEQPSPTWLPITDVTLSEPACPGDHEVWAYSVGAPGYAISSGTYASNA